MSKNINNLYDELDEEFLIDFKKIFLAIWSRKNLIIKVFVSVLVFFILLTFISSKKYIVNSDLYIKTSNSTNLAEMNPYIIEDISSATFQIGTTSSAMMNELEIIKSPLIIDKVIRENNLVYKKVFGIFSTKKTGSFLTTKAFMKKGIKIDNKKGTNVVTISYKSKKPELAYNVVNSIVNNYMALHSEIQAQKSQADIALLQAEYNTAKANLDAKLKQSNGLPTNSLNNTANIAVMSAFSNSAQSALSNIKGQYLEGERSEIAIKEEATKLAELSSKLEWAKIVNALSETSKVMIIAQPVQPKPYEQVSPKLFTNIILGIVLGVIGALFALIYAETTSKKLTYSMLGEKIIYDVEKDFNELKLSLISSQEKKILFAMFDNLPQSTYTQMQEFKNITFIKPDITTDFVNAVKNADEIVVVAKVGETDAKLFNQVKTIFKDMNKNISKEVLV